MMIMMLVVMIMSCIMLVVMMILRGKNTKSNLHAMANTQTREVCTQNNCQLTIIEYMGKNILVADTCTLWQIYTLQIHIIYMANTQSREVRAHNNWRMLSATSNIWASQPLTTPQMISSLQTLTQDLYPVVKSVPQNAPNYLQAFPGHQTCYFCKLGKD